MRMRNTWSAMKLKSYMTEKNLSLVDLARTSGVSASILSRYLRGLRAISVDNAARLSAATGGEVTVADLLYPDGLPEGARMAS